MTKFKGFKPKKKVSQEDLIQKACVKWFNFKHNKIKPYLYCQYNNPKSLQHGKHLKEMGLKAGIPDMFLAIPKNGYCGMYIEMKTKTGRLTKEQKQYSVILQEIGYKWVLCRSLEDFKKEIETYLK
jgi:hypothetical protein